MTGASILARTPVYDGFYRLWRLSVRMPDGAAVERHLEDHGSAVVVLPFDPERRVAMLVAMPRAAVIDAGEPPLLEAPAGFLDGDAEASARGEALDEAGLRLGALEPVGVVWSMPALSTERLHLFLARYAAADRVGAGGGTAGEHENIVAREVPLAELRRMRVAGELTDGKTLMLVQALELRAPELFGG